MTDNDYIAEYVKEKRPEIIHTLDFHFWKFGRIIKNVGDTIKAILRHDKEGGDEDDQECGYRPDVCGEEGDEGEGEDTYSEWGGRDSETDEI